jgi:hypothetical protein
VFKVLNSEYIESVKERFDGALIRDWFWAMFEEMREYFNTSMTPQEFEPGMVKNFPISTMDTVAEWIKYG